MAIGELGSMVKVAVIMPVYNGGEYLDTSIQSVLNQSYRDFQLICVNDSSTDNSLEILDKYASIDNRVVYLTKENAGPGLALNYGIENSQSDYLCFLDQDDKYAPVIVAEFAINGGNISSYPCFSV